MREQPGNKAIQVVYQYHIGNVNNRTVKVDIFPVLNYGEEATQYTNNLAPKPSSFLFCMCTAASLILATLPTPGKVHSLLSMLVSALSQRHREGRVSSLTRFGYLGGWIVVQGVNSAPPKSLTLSAPVAKRIASYPD